MDYLICVRTRTTHFIVGLLRSAKYAHTLNKICNQDKIIIKYILCELVELNIIKLQQVSELCESNKETVNACLVLLTNYL